MSIKIKKIDSLKFFRLDVFFSDNYFRFIGKDY